MESSRNLIDYKEYKLSKKEVVSYLIAWSVISTLFGYLFYKSWIAVLIILSGFMVYLKDEKKECALKRKNELRYQFKEVIMSVSAALRAGYSIENAFVEAMEEIRMIFGETSMMFLELKVFQKGMQNNITLEKLLDSLAERSGIDEIIEFSEVFRIAKRNGGDMNGIIIKCNQVICEKSEVNREIEVVIHAKKFEQKIMNLVPIFIIVYIQFSSPGFFEALYNNLIGIIIMTICLVIYVGAILLGKKITTFDI